MTRPMVVRSLLSSFLCLPFAVGQESPSPDRWRGLILDQSTPADCQRVLGNPKKDKVDRLAIYPIDRQFAPELKGKGLRKLTFTEVPGFREVALYFRADKLVTIQLLLKEEVAPSALQNLYGVEFSPVVSGFVESLGGIDRHAGSAYPRTYPQFYNLVGRASTSLVNAYVKNPVGIGATMRQAMGVPDTAGGGFPGKVVTIQLVSRTLENRKGEDLLR